jgi:hypothetical protein
VKQDTIKINSESSETRYSFDDIQNEDSIAYNNVMMGRDDDDEYKKIRVSEPQKNDNNVVYYNVVAFDQQGEFNSLRRYSDFEALRESWKKRIPGLYYPFLPPKKFIGNTDKSHVEERCFLLEQFLRKVYKIPYLVTSEEFSIFARHKH